MQPIFGKFVANNSLRSDVDFAKMDCDGINKEFCESFPRVHCPSVLVFTPEKEGYTECAYDIDWTIDDLNACLDSTVDEL
jgi:hypothetical protein